MDTYIMRIQHENLLNGKQYAFAIAVGDWNKLEPGLRQGCIVDAKLKMGEQLAAKHRMVLSPREYQLMDVSVWRYAEDDLDHPERVA